MALAQMEAPSPIGAMYVPSGFEESDREKKVGKEMIAKSSPIKARKPAMVKDAPGVALTRATGL